MLSNDAVAPGTKHFQELICGMEKSVSSKFRDSVKTNDGWEEEELGRNERGKEGTDVVERKGWEGEKHEDGLKRGRHFFPLMNKDYD